MGIFSIPIIWITSDRHNVNWKRFGHDDGDDDVGDDNRDTGDDE